MASRGAEIVSQLELVPLGTDDDGDPIESCVVVAAEADTATSKAAKVNGAAKIALEALYEAVAEWGEVVPDSHIPAKTRSRTASDARLSGLRKSCKSLKSLVFGTIAYGSPDKPDMRTFPARQSPGQQGHPL
jgi:hypothetical protein